MTRAWRLRHSATWASHGRTWATTRTPSGTWSSSWPRWSIEQLSTTTALVDTGRAFGNLGDCYDALGDSEEVIKCHEQVNHFAVFHGVELAFLTFCSMYAMIKVLTFPPFRLVPVHLTEDEEPSGQGARVPRPWQLTPRSGQPGAGAGLLREAPRRRP